MPKKLVYTAEFLGCEPRTDAFVRQHVPMLTKVLAGQIADKDETMGLILSSPFLCLIKMDMVQGFPYDYMHGTLLGVVKRLTNVILDAKQNEQYCLRPTRKTL